MCWVDRGVLALRSSPPLPSPLQPVSSQRGFHRRRGLPIPACPARRLSVRPLQSSSTLPGRCSFLWERISARCFDLPPRSAPGRWLVVRGDGGSVSWGGSGDVLYDDGFGDDMREDFCTESA